MVRTAIVVAALSTLAGQVIRGPAGTVVPGTANPNLAGRAGGYTCCGGDGSPPQDPVLVENVLIEGCDTLHFAATGRVSFDGGTPTGNNPDGDSEYSMPNYGDGIASALSVRTNALVGVFLSDDSPTGQDTPAQLTFAGEGGLAFGTIYPEIGQIFFIGDGLSSDSAKGETNGFLQHFVAPPQATRLYLGTVDGSGWFNNTGSFTVSIDSDDYDPPRECGDPVDPPGISTSDSLRVLRAAVGTSPCMTCVCDTDYSGSIAASDALAVLRKAVGQDTDLVCGCCLFC
jgi:hypothetical protein